MPSYYVDNIAGSDANAGTSTGLAKATINAALALCTAAGDVCWIKNTGTPYAEQANVTLAQGAAAGTVTSPSKLCGYTTTPGDGGRPTITGGGSRANCISCDRGFWSFENLVLTDATTRTFNLGINSSLHHFSRVDFLRGTTTLSQGFLSQAGGTSGRVNLIRCLFDGVTSNHLLANVSPKVVDCDFRNVNRSLNTSGVFDLQVLFSRFWNGATNPFISAGALSRSLIVGCSFDTSTMDAIDASSASNELQIILNNVFTNITGAGRAAIRSANNAGNIVGWNAFFNNTANLAGGIVSAGGDVSLPSLPWVGSGDFTLTRDAAGLALRRAGITGMDIGAYPAPEGGVQWLRGMMGGYAA